MASSFPSPSVTVAGENSGHETNRQAKKGYLLVAESIAPTWIFQIPLYNYVFLRFAEIVESYDRTNAYVGYNARTPEMVNLWLYNRHMEEKRECMAKPKGTKYAKTYDPLFMMNEARVSQQFWPFGVTDTPEWDVRDVLGRSQQDRVINILHRGHIKLANYCDSSLCGTYHLYWVKKLLDIRTKDPVFHVAYGGSPAVKHPRAPGVKQVTHWFMVAVKDHIDIEKARQYKVFRPDDEVISEEEEAKYEDNHTGDAVYYCTVFFNKLYDSTNHLTSPDVFEFPVCSQEKIRSAGYMEVNLNQST